MGGEPRGGQLGNQSQVETAFLCSGWDSRDGPGSGRGALSAEGWQVTAERSHQNPKCLIPVLAPAFGSVLSCAWCPSSGPSWAGAVPSFLWVMALSVPCGPCRSTAVGCAVGLPVLDRHCCTRPARVSSKRPGWSQDQAPTIWGGGDIRWSCYISLNFLVQILCSHPRQAGNMAERAIVPHFTPILYFKGLFRFFP